MEPLHDGADSTWVENDLYNLMSLRERGVEKIIVLICALWVGGCAGPDRLAREWYGRPIGDVVTNLGTPDRIVAVSDRRTEISYHRTGVRGEAYYDCDLVFVTDTEGIIRTHRYAISPGKPPDGYEGYGKCGALLVEIY